MRTKNSPLISVVIPRSQESFLTARWAAEQLAETPHEIIEALSWVIGSNQAHGEYVCFLEKDCVLTENYFDGLLEIFEGQSSFRKLAMVAPAVGINSYVKKIYGYKFEDNVLKPKLEPSSLEPYLVQVAYIPGALIRRSALGYLAPSRDALGDSATLSIFLWDHGQRVVLDPNTLYISTEETLLDVYEFENPVSKIKAHHISELFNRERIG